MTFFTELEKSILMFTWKYKQPWIAKADLNKKCNAGDITIPYFKLYYRALAIKKAQYWHKNKHKDQIKRIEDSEINTHSYSHVIFNKGAQNMQKR
jgi:hypothetical protein